MPSPTEQLRQRYPDLLPTNADPALARAIEELDTTARSLRESLAAASLADAVELGAARATSAAPVVAPLPPPPRAVRLQ